MILFERMRGLKAFRKIKLSNFQIIILAYKLITGNLNEKLI